MSRHTKAAAGGEVHPKTFWQDFKLFFWRGLVILLPTVLTLWILVQAYRFVYANVAEPINSGIRQVIIKAAPALFSDDELPTWFVVNPEQVALAKRERTAQASRPLSGEALRAEIRERNLREWWNDHYLGLIGLVVAVVLIYLAGLLLGGLIGRRVYGRIEKFFRRLPVIRSVYPHVKQVVEFLLGEEQKAAFNKVVLVEYPRKGIWTVGLMTGTSMRAIESVAADGCITVFIPSSPTPFTGYTITVKKEDAVDLPISIDEALRFVISGGVLVPERQQIEPNELAERFKAAQLTATAQDRPKEDE